MKQITLTQGIREWTANCRKRIPPEEAEKDLKELIKLFEDNKKRLTINPGPEPEKGKTMKRYLKKWGDRRDDYIPGESLRLRWHIEWIIVSVKYNPITNITTIALTRSLGLPEKGKL